MDAELLTCFMRSSETRPGTVRRRHRSRSSALGSLPLGNMKIQILTITAVSIVRLSGPQWRHCGQSPPTLAPTGGRRSRWYRRWPLPTFGTPRSVLARYSTVCYESDSFIPTDYLERGPHRIDANALTGINTNQRGTSGKRNAPWFGEAGDNSTIWDSPSPKFIMGGSKEEECDHPTQNPVELMRRPILNHTSGVRPSIPWIGHNPHRCRDDRANSVMKARAFGNFVDTEVRRLSWFSLICKSGRGTAVLRKIV